MFIKNYNKKQVILLFTAILFIFCGYFNYLYTNQDTIEYALENKEEKLGDVELVSANAVETNAQIVPNEETTTEYENSYYAETKLEREKLYSELVETYQKIVDNEQTPSDQKAIAINEISNIAKEKNGINIAENLIKNKGYKDVVILINNKKINVIVDTIKLEKEDISKIQNIVERELGVETSQINISNR